MPRKKAAVPPKNKVFRSVEDIRATYLPDATATFGADTLADPERAASVMAVHIMRDVRATVARRRR